MMQVTEGRVMEILDTGFRLDTGAGEPTTVATLRPGPTLGLRPGQWVKVYGGYDPERGVFASSRAYGRDSFGREVSIPINPGDREERPWWKLW